MKVERHNGGNGQTSTRYCFRIRLAGGRRVRIFLFDSKTASEAAARKIEELRDIRAAGTTLPQGLAAWVANLTADLQRDLVKVGLLDASTQAAQSLLINLEGDVKDGVTRVEGYRQYLNDKNNGASYVTLKVSRIRTVLEAGKMRYPSDLSPSRVLGVLSDMRKDGERRGISLQTANHYATGLKGFSKWLHRNGRHHVDGLLSLDKLKPSKGEAVERRPRGSFKADEVRYLLTHVQHAPHRYGMSGRDRALLYLLAVDTGLRSAELRSLTVGSFIETPLGIVARVSAGYTKNREGASPPIRPETFEALSLLVKGRKKSEPLFKMPYRSLVCRMLSDDREEARLAWVEENPQRSAAFLAKLNEEGQSRDMHSFRHSFVSAVVESGTDVKTAQSLARHKTPSLTIGRYAHASKAKETAAIASLPILFTFAPPLGPDLDHGDRTGRKAVEAGGGEGQNPETLEDGENSLENAGESGFIACGCGVDTMGPTIAGSVPERLNGPVLKTGGPERVP